MIEVGKRYFDAKTSSNVTVETEWVGEDGEKTGEWLCRDAGGSKVFRTEDDLMDIPQGEESDEPEYPKIIDGELHVDDGNITVHVNHGDHAGEVLKYELYTIRMLIAAVERVCKDIIMSDSEAMQEVDDYDPHVKYYHPSNSFQMIAFFQRLAKETQRTTGTYCSHQIAALLWIESERVIGELKKNTLSDASLPTGTDQEPSPTIFSDTEAG